MKPNESPAPKAREATSPFPPAFRWDAFPSDPAEAPTQVLRPLGWDAAAGSPQEVTQLRWTEDTEDVDGSERTRVIRSTPAYQQRPDEVRDLFQPVGTPFGEPNTSSAPPWTHPTHPQPPPLAEHQSAWLHQGADGFGTPARQSRPKQVIGLTVLAVVVLGLVGATVAYSLTSGPGRTGSDEIDVSPPSAALRDLPAPPAPLPPPVDTAHALIDPPGQPRGDTRLFDLSQLSTNGLLPDFIVEALQANAMIDGVYKGTTVSANTIGMFAFTMPDPQAAATVTDTIVAKELRNGLRADYTHAMQRVTVMDSAPGSTQAVYRAVYVLYSRVIFFEVYGKNPDDVLASFDPLLKEQVTYAPPTVRAGR